MGHGLRQEGLTIRVQVLFWVLAFKFRDSGLHGFRVSGLHGFRVSGFRVQGVRVLGFRVLAFRFWCFGGGGLLFEGLVQGRESRLVKGLQGS